MSPDLRRLAHLLEEGAKLLGSAAKVLGVFQPPPVSEDPYQVLGVSAGDPPERIRKVYRALAKVLHPDNPATGNAEAYKRVHAAYEALTAKKGRSP